MGNLAKIGLNIMKLCEKGWKFEKILAFFEKVFLEIIGMLNPKSRDLSRYSKDEDKNS
jgi:hypothetical protein